MPLSADFPFQEYLPFWDALPREMQTELRAAAQLRHAHTDQVIHTGGRCDGFFIIVSGRLRCRTAAESGRSITLFRLFAHDVCLFSASCILKSISFTVTIEAECDTDYLRIPPAVYRRVSAASAQAAQFTNEILASRFSDVMWLMDQLLNRRMDARIAGFLIEEARLCGSDTLHITHEKIAQHLGSAREVVTRVLNYLAHEGMITLFRGGIAIADSARLSELAEDAVP